jgi:hypothetical protein
MAHVVIIGGGPCGLYLASKLLEAGVTDIVIYEPREHYERPGFIYPHDYGDLKQILGARHPLFTDIAYIRNVEKALQTHILQKGRVRIERKEFRGFAPNGRDILVAPKDESAKETVSCDYLFDCTGGKRALVSEANRQMKAKERPEPFQFSYVSEDVIIKKHLIACIHLETSMWVKLRQQMDADLSNRTPFRTPLRYAQDIEKLRKFGWMELAFPKCYLNGAFKPRKKNILYVECPDNLREDEKEAWLKTVLEVICQQPVTFQYSQPKSKRSKPYFTLFEVNPRAIKQFSWKEGDLPILITAGDCQVDPHYMLAHGMKNGFSRINLMLHTMAFTNGKITSFDRELFHQYMTHALVSHKDELSKYYRDQKKHLRDSIVEGSHKLKEAGSDLSAQIINRVKYYDALEELKTIPREQPLSRGKIIHLVDLTYVIKNCLPSMTPFEQEEAKKHLDLKNFKHIDTRLFQLLYSLREISNIFLKDIEHWCQNKMEICLSLTENRPLKKLPSNLLITLVEIISRNPQSLQGFKTLCSSTQFTTWLINSYTNSQLNMLEKDFCNGIKDDPEIGESLKFLYRNFPNEEPLFSYLFTDIPHSKNFLHALRKKKGISLFDAFCQLAQDSPALLASKTSLHLFTLVLHAELPTNEKKRLVTQLIPHLHIENRNAFLRDNQIPDKDNLDQHIKLVWQKTQLVALLEKKWPWTGLGFFGPNQKAMSNFHSQLNTILADSTITTLLDFQFKSINACNDVDKKIVHEDTNETLKSWMVNTFLILFVVGIVSFIHKAATGRFLFCDDYNPPHIDAFVKDIYDCLVQYRDEDYGPRPT